MLHNRLANNRNHRLGALDRQWSQPRSFSTCHDDRFHRGLLISILANRSIGHVRLASGQNDDDLFPVLLVVPPKNRIIEAKLQQYQTDEYVPYVFLALFLSASIGGLSHHHLYASDIERLGN